MSGQAEIAPAIYVSEIVWEAILDVTDDEPVQELTLFVQRDDQGVSQIMSYPLGVYVPVVVTGMHEVIYGIVLSVDYKRSAVTLVI